MHFWQKRSLLQTLGGELSVGAILFSGFRLRSCWSTDDSMSQLQTDAEPEPRFTTADDQPPRQLNPEVNAPAPSCSWREILHVCARRMQLNCSQVSNPHSARSRGVSGHDCCLYPTPRLTQRRSKSEFLSRSIAERARPEELTQLLGAGPAACS